MLANWISKYANENDLREIEAAIASAESRTSGEIVPMVVRESSYGGHVPYLLTFLILSFLLVALPVFESQLSGPIWIWEAGSFVLAVVLGFALSRSTRVRRFFTPHLDQAHAVFHRAQLEFHQTGIPATKGHTGVLIFVSLHERRAVILGDQAISEKLNESTWLEIVNGLLKEMSEGKLREGFVHAITKVGEVLAREFPASAHDTNELPNTLIIKE